MTVQLLTTKLFIPSLRVEHVSRARLVAHLNTCFSHALTLVSAPAGYGKTTLLSEWAKGCCSPIAWLTIDPGDNDPVRFIAYLAAAFREAGISNDTMLAPSPGLPDSLTPLINSLSTVSGPVILILDDYHLISSQAVHNCLAFLLDFQPDNLHTIISTRADPPLPLARLRGRRQLAEIRLADLRFTDAEAEQLISQVEGFHLSQRDMRILTERTEGWAAGLQMASATLRTLQQTRNREEVSEFLQAFSGCNRYILDYLMEEVLAYTSEDVRSFLYQTSILTSFTADLCAEVIATQAITQNGITAQDFPISPGRCQSILEQLEQANLFILPLDPDRKWYRYHPLFADLLQKRLNELVPGIVPELFQRASRWFALHGWAEPAIEYALLSKKFGYAADLLQKNAENLLMRGELVNFSRWAHTIPEDELHAHPLLTVFHGFTLVFDGVPEEIIENHLRRAERYQPDRVSEAAILTLRSLLMIMRGEYQTSEAMARQAMRELPPEFVFLENYLRGSLASAQLWSGNNDEAIRTFEDALEAGKKAGNRVFTPLVMRRLARLYTARGQLRKAGDYLEEALKFTLNSRGDLLPHAGMILVNRGDLKREWNDLDGAEADIRKGIELLSQWGKVRIADAYVLLAETLRSRGNWHAAREAMQQAVEKAHQTEEYEVDDLRVAHARARLAIRQGDLITAQQWVDATGFANDPGPVARLSGDQPLPSPLLNYMRRMEYLVLARLRLAQGQPHLALQTLDELLMVFEKEGWTSFILETELIRALALDACGDRQACFVSLRRALELAQANTFFRILIDEGDPMQSILQSFLSETGKDYRNLHPFVQRLLAGFVPQSNHLPAQAEYEPGEPETHPPEPLASPTRGNLVEPLSERELEVLRLLSTYLTVPEIAGRMGISTSTARTHIKHIYEKLDVHTRIEAVERAGKLNQR